MIAKLKGVLDSTGDGWAIIDVNGVGYLVFASSRTLSALPRPGSEAEFLIDTHVREDHIHLFGFATEAERGIFRHLQSVQGVGAKSALGILSAFAPDELSSAIAAQDKKALTRASGVGPKLAARIVTELKDKVTVVPMGSAESGSGPAVPILANGAAEDAISALVNLGYRRMDAHAAVARAAAQLGEGAGLQDLIRTGLRELTQ